MAIANFKHGVELLQIDAGARPIQTVSSSVIGICGTAPDSQAEVKASAAFGVIASNNALTITSKLTGVLGNKVSIRLVDPAANSATLAVTVSGNAITASLATSSGGAITTTAALLKTAIEGNTDANALVAVANTGASTGAGVLAALNTTLLTGGLDEPFPLNTPVVVAGSRLAAAKLGTTGSLPAAIESIFDQTGAVLVVVRVEEGEDEDATLANVVGGVNATTDQYEGVSAFLGSESKTGVVPRILIAPDWTHQRPEGNANPVAAELAGIAERLRACIVLDGPSTTYDDAVAYAGDFDNKRMYVVDPRSTKLDSDGAITYARSSAVAAGLIAKVDNDEGFWNSPSNRAINGIIGTERQIDSAYGDFNSGAQLLNNALVATIIRRNGFRLWGNRTLSSDPRWTFLSNVRTMDIIIESVGRAQQDAVDRNITKNFVEFVVESVNNYGRTLVNMGALLYFNCYADPDLNSAGNIALGKLYLNIDATPPTPAELISFQVAKVDDGFVTLFE